MADLKNPNPYPDNLHRSPTGEGDGGYNLYSWDGNIEGIPATFGMIEPGFDSWLKTESLEIIIVHQGFMKIGYLPISPMGYHVSRNDVAELRYDAGERFRLGPDSEFKLRVPLELSASKHIPNYTDTLYTCITPAEGTDPEIIKQAVKTAASLKLE